MLRREFLATLAAVAPLTGWLTAESVNRIDRSRLSAITDEIALTPEEAFAFAHHYKLRCVELRRVPGVRKDYDYLTESDLKEAAQQFRDNGLRITFLNTGYFKFPLPGTEAAREREETPAEQSTRLAREKATFENRTEEVRRGARAAAILGVDMIRVFTFARVRDPKSVEHRVADILGELALVAEKEGVKLVVENEASCNAGTSAELASYMRLLSAKNVGLNWDPLNGADLGEVQFPTGYNTLPKHRIWNVQAKGKSLLEPAKKLDWAGIFTALEHDGYKGTVGLETHYFDGTNIEKAHLSMEEMIRIAESPRT